MFVELLTCRVTALGGWKWKEGWTSIGAGTWAVPSVGMWTGATQAFGLVQIIITPILFICLILAV